MIKIIIVLAILSAVFSTGDLALTNSVSQQDEELIAIKELQKIQLQAWTSLFIHSQFPPKWRKSCEP